MDNIDSVKDELKKLRNELFELRFKQKMTNDEYSLNKFKEEENIILDKYRRLAAKKVNLEDKGGRKK